MTEPFPPPPSPTPLPQATVPSATSTGAVVSLALGVVGIFCCGGVPGPFAWWLGARELRAVNERRSAESNRPLAIIGIVLGIVGTVMLASWLIWIAFFGGLAMLGALAGAAGV
jgi:hypothetical protein